MSVRSLVAVEGCGLVLVGMGIWIAISSFPGSQTWVPMLGVFISILGFITLVMVRRIYKETKEV